MLQSIASSSSHACYASTSSVKAASKPEYCSQRSIPRLIASAFPEPAEPTFETQHYVTAQNRIYSCLAFIDNMFREKNIDYAILRHTALGAIKHAALAPLNACAFIGVREFDEYKIAKLEARFDEVGFRLTTSPCGYIVRPIEKGAITPYVDILVLHDTIIRRVPRHVQVNIAPLPDGAFNRLRDVSFGNVRVRALSADDAATHLANEYGGLHAIYLGYKAKTCPSIALADIVDCTKVPNQAAGRLRSAL